jgi:hypothetical protein
VGAESQPVAPQAPPERHSLLTILRDVAASRDFAIRLMTGATGAIALGWLGAKGAFAGLVLSQLLADTIKEFVTNHDWNVRRVWFVTALALLFGRLRRRIAETGTTPVAVPLVSTLAATVVVIGAFTAVDAARGQSLIGHRHTTFFGGTARATAPSVQLPDGRLVTSAARLSFGDTRVGGSSASRSIVLSSGSHELRRLRIEASPAAFHVVNGCPSRLSARSSCGIAVAFQPNRQGQVEGRLTISFEQDPELTLVLEGTAVAVVGAVLEPTSLHFGQATIGSATQPQTITLRAGNVALPVARIASGSKEFTIADDCPARLRAGDTCRIRIVFAPRSEGSHTSTLRVTRPGGGRALTATLTGTAVSRPTQATLTPPQADFGDVLIGAPSQPRAFTLTAGSTAVTGVKPAADPTDYVVESTTCGDRLAAGGTCTISVVFTPSAAGRRAGTLTVGRAGGAPLTASLTGGGVVAGPKLTPGEADFGSVDIGTSSAPTTFTLTAGTSTLAIGAISVATSDYQITANTCPAQLAAGQSCKIGVTFLPTAEGKLLASLVVVRTDGGQQLSAPLSGLGVAVAPTLAPETLDFGEVQLGAHSTPMTLTLSAGSSPFPYARMTTQSKDFRLVANTCSGTIAASSTCTIDVVFSPVTIGDRSVTLTVTRSDGGPPLMATLSGVGLAANVVLSPTSIDFSNSTVQMVTLSNTGNATLTITGFTSDDTKHFTVASGTCGSTLEAGGVCTFSVTFLAAAGNWQATITVEADGRGQHTLVVSASRIG